MPKVILITGAAGSIGRKLTAHFRSKGHSLLLVDVAVHPGGGIEQADLSRWGSWADRFEGVDCVIHLAADAEVEASWQSVARNNIDATLNVFEAAARGGAKRVIFASSGFVLEGHSDSATTLDEEVPPAPINAYGASKLAGESIGRFFGASRNLSVICFRIGACGREEENLSCRQLGVTAWQQQKWLSDRDLCKAFELAVEAPNDIRFEIFNLVSRNEGMRWDMSKAERLLGFRAADSSVPFERPRRKRIGQRLRALLSSFSLRRRASGAAADPKTL